MGLPVSGIVLIPLTLGVSLFSPYLLEWAIFSAVLQGAALVNIGSGFPIGLSTYFFVVALGAIRVIPRWAGGKIRFFDEEPALMHMRMAALFTAWAVFSAFALPVFFKGLPVDSPRLGVDRGYYTQVPLHWSFSNAGQAGYMVLNFLMVVWLLDGVARPKRLERLVNAFSWSGIFVVAVGAYQIVCNHIGLPFPSSFFNSNEAWAQAPNQIIGAGFSRVSATFVEPSEAAAFLAAWSVFELCLAIWGQRHSGWHWLLAALGSVMLVETTSTTGYVTAGIIWLVALCDCGIAMLRRGWIKVKPTLAVIAFAAATLVVLARMPRAWLLLDAVLVHKGQSQSAVHRLSTFGIAVDVFLHSWGLGAGLGSNRAMSVLFYVLSNLGFPGLLLGGFLLAHLCSNTWRSLHRHGVDPEMSGYLLALGGALLANVVALMLSGAEITQPRLWILWGLLLAAVRKDWLIERQSQALDCPTILSQERSHGAASPVERFVNTEHLVHLR
ncbi:MAG TPA: hypothetical protein VJ728_04940 [Candidatus Binataceae bacterium]|nr:hypothetical protein [Candidatus Binataceae bacterium]